MSNSPPSPPRPNRQLNRSVGTKWHGPPTSSREYSSKRAESGSNNPHTGASPARPAGTLGGAQASPYPLARVRLSPSPSESVQMRESSSSPSGSGGSLSARSGPMQSAGSPPRSRSPEPHGNMSSRGPLPPPPPPPLNMPLPAGPLGLSLNTQEVMFAMGQLVGPLGLPLNSQEVMLAMGQLAGPLPVQPPPAATAPGRSEAPPRTAATVQPRPTAGSPARPALVTPARPAGAPGEAGPSQPRSAGRAAFPLGLPPGSEGELRQQIRHARGAIQFAQFEINRLQAGGQTVFNPSLSCEQEIDGLREVIVDEGRIIARCDEALRRLGVRGASATSSVTSVQQHDSGSESADSVSSRSSTSPSAPPGTRGRGHRGGSAPPTHGTGGS